MSVSAPTVPDGQQPATWMRTPYPGELASPNRVHVVRAAENEHHVGIDLAVLVQQATGLPAGLSEAQLRDSLAQRQTAAEGVWLALVDHVVVGHALAAIVGDDHHTWGRIDDNVVATARRRGKLVELGGLCVHPDYQHRGIARRLQHDRLHFARSRGLLPVAAAWSSSPGSMTLCNGAGREVGAHHELPITLFALDRTA